MRKTGLMTFKPNRKFRREYRKIFRKDPVAANLFLLIAELADQNGQMAVIGDDLTDLFNVRFPDPEVWAL